MTLTSGSQGFPMVPKQPYYQQNDTKSKNGWLLPERNIFDIFENVRIFQKVIVLLEIQFSRTIIFLTRLRFGFVFILKIDEAQSQNLFLCSKDVFFNRFRIFFFFYINSLTATFWDNQAITDYNLDLNVLDIDRVRHPIADVARYVTRYMSL